ncbi:MAG: glycosyltransferase family 2 protein [Gemmatimonadetes bacterium]|nr:MAG: glycosyltransferase family 2 protein [Gemmatimonadota bacterium]
MTPLRAYYRIWGYWSKKLKGHPDRAKFMALKFVEILIFALSPDAPPPDRPPYKPFPPATKNAVPESPTIALVVPCYIKDEMGKQQLEMLIRTIQQQTRQPDWIILVDDASPFSYDLDSPVEIIRLAPNGGPARARNAGKARAEELGADIIAFTDSDCRLSPTWVETIIEAFQTSREFQILSGNTLSYGNSWFDNYHEINGTLNGRQFKDSNRLLYGTTANLAITRNVNQQIGFNDKFPSAAGEDIEFCFRANEFGYAIGYIPAMVVYHDFNYSNSLQDNLQKFVNLFRKYAAGQPRLLKIIPNYYDYLDKTEGIRREH